MIKECVQGVWMSDHREFLEEAAVTGSPVEPKFCRMFVLELPLSNFILCTANLGVLGSAAFPLGFPLPHKRRSTGFVLNGELASARPLWDSEHLVEEVLSCLSPVSPQHPAGEIPEDPLPGTWAAVAVNEDSPKAPQKQSFVLLNWAVNALGIPESLASPVDS